MMWTIIPLCEKASLFKARFFKGINTCTNFRLQYAISFLSTVCQLTKVSTCVWNSFSVSNMFVYLLIFLCHFSLSFSFLTLNSMFYVVSILSMFHFLCFFFLKNLFRFFSSLHCWNGISWGFFISSFVSFFVLLCSRCVLCISVMCMQQIYFWFSFFATSFCSHPLHI